MLSQAAVATELSEEELRTYMNDLIEDDKITASQLSPPTAAAAPTPEVVPGKRPGVNRLGSGGGGGGGGGSGRGTASAPARLRESRSGSYLWPRGLGFFPYLIRPCSSMYIGPGSMLGSMSGCAAPPAFFFLPPGPGWGSMPSSVRSRIHPSILT